MIDQTKLRQSLVGYHRQLHNAGDEVMAAVCLTLMMSLRTNTPITKASVIEQIMHGVEVARSRNDQASVYAGEILIEQISLTGGV